MVVHPGRISNASAVESVHVGAGAADDGAVIERPDPVEQDREEVLAVGGRGWVRGSRRRALSILAAIAVGGGLVTGLLVTREHNHAAANHPPSGVAGRPATPVASPTNASHPRMTLHGSPVTGRIGVQVLISPHGGSTPAWFTPDTGTLTPLDLPPNAQGYVVQAFPGGALLLPGTSPPCDRCPGPACDNCPGPPVPVYYAATGSSAVTRLGAANADVAVTADHAAVWLSSYRLATEPYSSRSQTLAAQKVDLSGHRLGPPVRLPAGYQLPPIDPLGSLPQPAGRLLLARTNPTAATDRYTLWNPRSRTPTASFDFVRAVSAHQIAWTAASCTEASCPLQLTDPTTGITNTQSAPPGRMPTTGSYSPDGRHLALLVTAPRYSGPSGAVAIGLLNEATHRLTVIPGTILDIIPTLTWSADGRWLLIGNLGDSQLGLINPHTRQLQVTTIPD